LHLAKNFSERSVDSSAILFVHNRLRNGMAVAENIGMMLPQTFKTQKREKCNASIAPGPEALSAEHAIE
jgi:hypothetical protein